VFSFPPLTPVVKKLVITLFAAFVVELILQNVAHWPVIQALALDPLHLGPHTLYQIVSYALVEDPRSVMSMLVGLLFMWLILSPFEASFGARRTLELSLCGVLGAAFSAILAAQLAPASDFLLYGSQTIAYAGMAVMTQVMRGGRMMFFGVVPMTTQQLLLLLIGLCVLEYLSSMNHIMLAGSLGSIFAGLGYARYMTRPPRSPRKQRDSGPRFRVLRGGGGAADNERPKWLN
jgi:membrane associated rhomboid family serine protease